VKNEYYTLTANDYREDLFTRARYSLGNLRDRVIKIASKKKGDDLEAAIKKVER
jgi:hypothetical protein